MFKPMKKIVRIGDTGVELEIHQNENGNLSARWADGYTYLFPSHHDDRKLIAALGFPTEPIEETVEEIEGVIE